MGLWEKVQQELDRAGSVARDALDEGKVRIELFRVRQQADKAAQALGYAVRRARRDGKEIEPATMERLDNALAEFEATAKKLESELARALHKDDAASPDAKGDTKGDAQTPESDPAAAPASAGTTSAESASDSGEPGKA